MNKATCERPKCVENYGKFFQKYHRAIIDKGDRNKIESKQNSKNQYFSENSAIIM